MDVAARPTANRRPEWMYMAIVGILGLSLLAGVGAWVALIFVNKQMPTGLATVMATIAGGLVGALTAGGGSRPRD